MQRISNSNLANVASQAADKAKNTTNVVYQGIDKLTGAVRYIGITARNPAMRFNEHLTSGTEKALLDFRLVPGATSLTRLEARIWEQTLINAHGLSNLLNKRNEIAPVYWDLYGIPGF